MAFGDEYNIGVISVQPQDYSTERWYKSSAGAKPVIFKLIAYIYVRFFFVSYGV